MNDSFFKSYVQTALWSSSDEDEEPLDSVHTIDDISPECLARMSSDCEQFLEACQSELGFAYPDYNRSDYSDAELAGQDFWLTRNGHGAGFWDRGLGEIGDRLTKIAKAEGTAYLYIGDDGWIHHC